MLEISGYTIIKQIGQGGMAVVYSAVQESVNRQVALKVLSPNILGDPVFCKRFLREARISGQLKHPQIVTIFDVSSDANNHYICMEYLSGGDLSKRLDNKTVTTSMALAYTISIAQTLADAHQQGFVHRDIKPAIVIRV